MSAMPRKTPGAGGRPGVESAPTRALPALYGTGRDRSQWIHDLSDAAARLIGIAEGFAAGTFDGRALAFGDALAVGLARLIVESRARAAVREVRHAS